MAPTHHSVEADMLMDECWLTMSDRAGHCRYAKRFSNFAFVREAAHRIPYVMSWRGIGSLVE